MTAILIAITINLLGLAAIWLYVRARVSRALELDSLVEGIRKEIRALTIELNETADRNVSLVEDRMEALRSLLEEADRRMGVMRKELETRAGEREVYSHLGRARRGGAPEAPLVQSSPVPAAQEELASGPVEVGQRAAPAEPIRLELPRRPSELIQLKASVIPPKSLREEALELYDKGFSSDIIAARLGATIAEIDLLVSLEERRREGGGGGA